MKQTVKRILSALLCLTLLLSLLPMSGIAADIHDEDIEFGEEIEIPPLTGVSVSGSINSSANAKGAAYVELWSEVPYQLAHSLSTEEDTYIFEGVEPGTYTMVARKASCVLFSETVTVEYTPVTQNVKLRSPGDINGDGRINVSDISSIYAHVKGTRELTGYELSCANVNDGPLDIVDVAMVYAHIKGTKKIEPRNSVLPEDIFVKTVDDFKGYEVVQLGEQADTNFVVYNKGVKALTSTATTNVLLFADESNLIYTFVNPDDTMKALKVGDVFYTMPATSDTPGISAKIRKIVFMGNAVTVYSDPVEMDDLFRYIDVDELDLSGTSQERRSASGSTETHIGDIPFRLPLEFSMGGDNVTANLGCVVGGRLTEMVFRMKYSAEDLYFSYEFTGDLVIAPEFTFGFEGTVSGEKEKEFGSYPIPAIPGLKLTPSLVGTVQVSGTLEGTWNMEMVYDFGIRFDTHQGLKRWFDPVGTTYGDVEVEMDGALTLGAGFKLGLGIIGIWQAYVQADISWTAEGDLVKPEENPPANARCIHGCKRCIDGECHFDVTVKVGMEAKELLKKLKLNVDLSMGLLTFENLSPKEFYCAFPKDGGVEFGWDECPYKRWRTTIRVTKEGDPVENMDVSATFGKETETFTTDKAGKAIFYLPDGKWKTWCTHDGKVRSKYVTVNENPTSVEIRLEPKKGKLYIVVASCFWSNYEVQSHSFEYDKAYLQAAVASLDNKYPDAIVIVEDDTPAYNASPEVPSGIEPGDCVLFLVWDRRTKEIDTDPSIEYYRGMYLTSIAVRFYVHGYGYVIDQNHRMMFIATNNLRIGNNGYHNDVHIALMRCNEWGEPDGDILYSCDSRNIDRYPYEGVFVSNVSSLVAECGNAALQNMITKAYPYVDLWLSGDWYENVEQLIP